MAITIKSAPQASGFVSANEDVWHVVDSTNKNVIGFKYIFDIYKGANLLTRITNSPYGNDGYGVINVGNIVRSAVAVDTIGDLNLTTSYTPNSIQILEAGADYWWGEYVVNYGEVCGVTNLGEPIILSDLASGTHRVYNTYNRHEIHGAGAALSSGLIFLTNRPNESYFYYGQPIVVSINSKRITVGQVCRVQIEVDDPNQDYSFVEKTAIDGFFYFSVNQINSDFNLIFEDSTSTDLGSLRLIKRCSKYKPYTLIFLNAYGAWDSFTFVNGNILTDNEKKKFEQMEWRLNGFNMVNKNGKVRYEGMRTYGVDFKTKMKLTTDLLSTEEYKWLFELIVSPLVYLWDKDSSLLHPVQITDTSYEMKNSLQNKAETLDVNIDVYKQNTQYR
jgi:hypothetical protein